VDRIYGRGLWVRFGDKTPEEVSRFVNHSHHAVTLALNAAEKAGWPVLEIDNSAGDPALAASQLREKLARYPLPAEESPTWLAAEQASEIAGDFANENAVENVAESLSRS
jgi:hypothetical protein